MTPLQAQSFGGGPFDFRGLPKAVKTLLLANIAGFLLFQIVGGQFVEIFGLIPRQVTGSLWLWQPITYLFIHGGLLHLLINLWILWMFGVPVEAQWGSREFYKFYFLCGLGAAATQILVAPHSDIPVIGASGAIYGLLVAFAMLYPEAVIYVYFFFPLKAAHAAVLFGLLEFYFSMNSPGGRIAHFAHLGGMATGYAYLRWWWIAKIKIRALWQTIEESTPLGGIFSGARPRRAPPRRPEAPRPPEEPEMEDIDKILDKILASGLNSLTDKEREIMERYSRRTKSS